MARWWNRLRVRGGNLVLEARGIPRGSDEDLRNNVLLLLRELDIRTLPSMRDMRRD